jgi:hypothetical protein
LTMNRYLYALANPATLVDPDGHLAQAFVTAGGCEPDGSGCPGLKQTLTRLHAVTCHGTSCGTTKSSGTAAAKSTLPTAQSSLYVPGVGPVNLQGGGYVDPGGGIHTNQECLQWSGLPCANTLDVWGWVPQPTHELAGWSPEEYLAGSSTAGARNALRLLGEIHVGEQTGNWWGFGLDAGGLTVGAAAQLAAVAGSPELLLGVGRMTAGSRLTEAVAPARGGVYTLRGLGNDVVRTGRTSDLAARRSALARDPILGPYEFSVEYRTDVYAEQRGLEQVLYDRYPGAQIGAGGFNKIRAISPTNPNLEDYVQAARDYLAALGL